VLFLRGCRDAGDPFFPIDRVSLLESFDPQLFEIGPDIPFFYAVDTGGIPATAITIARRETNVRTPFSFLKWLTKAAS
jgi:hypothetical protein